MSQIFGQAMGSPMAIVDTDGRLHTNEILDGVQIRGSGVVMFPKSDDRLLNGNMFSCGHVFKNVTGSTGILYHVGSLSLHLNWTARADMNTSIKLFEDVSVSNSGTACNSFSLNRQDGYTINSKAFFGPTVTDSGTYLVERYLLGGSGTNWRTATDNLATSTYDILLKSGLSYWIKLDNESGRAGIISYKGIAHEHG